MGTVTTTAPAMISPKGTCLETLPVKSEIATGIVLAPGAIVVKVSAKMYSFQAAMKASSPDVTIAGAVSGNKIIRNVWKGVAPSTHADCIISEGNSLKKAVNTHVVKGRVKIMYESIRLSRVLRFSVVMTA